MPIFVPNIFYGVFFIIIMLALIQSNISMSSANRNISKSRTPAHSDLVYFFGFPYSFLDQIVAMHILQACCYALNFMGFLFLSSLSICLFLTFAVHDRYLLQALFTKFQKLQSWSLILLLTFKFCAHTTKNCNL